MRQPMRQIYKRKPGLRDGHRFGPKTGYIWKPPFDFEYTASCTVEQGYKAIGVTFPQEGIVIHFGLHDKPYKGCRIPWYEIRALNPRNNTWEQLTHWDQVRAWDVFYCAFIRDHLEELITIGVLSNPENRL